MGPLKSLRYLELFLVIFSYRKDKTKVCLIQQDFLLQYVDLARAKSEALVNKLIIYIKQ